MEIIDFDNICRICWNDSFLRTVFNEDIPSLCEMLMACAPLEVCQENGLPTKICENCSSDLEKAYAFREKCIQSEMKFRKYFDEHAVIITEKTELTYEPETVIVMEEFGEDAYLATNENGETTLIQASSLDPSIKASLEAATLEGKTTTVITTDENGTVIEEDTTLKDVTIITEDGSEEIDISNMLEFQDSTDEIIETTVTTESEELQPVQKFGCNLCEREYSHPRNLKRHVREDHSGKKKIPCSGTRNYRCSICRRIFSFKNALIRHLRVVHRDITKKYFMVKNGKKCCSKDIRIFFENAQEPAKEVKGILGEIENNTDDPDDTDDDYSDNLSEHVFQFSSDVVSDDENETTEVKVEPESDGPPGGKILQTLLLTKSGKQKIKHAPDSRRGQKVKVVKNLVELKDQMEKKNSNSKKIKKDTEDQTVFIVEEGIFKDIVQSQEDSQEECEIREDEIDGQKPQFACDLCGKLFTIRSNLKRHLNMVHRVAEKVRYNSEFNNSSTITDEVIEEIRNEHKEYEEDVNEDGTKTKKYQCDMCERSYYAKNNLKRHLKEKHLPKEPTPDREFMCELCGRAFARKGLLERHKDSHSERQGYQCEHCGEVFPKRAKLSQHVVKHQREKKYQCDVCGKWFLRPATLKIHKRLHDPVLPYPCTVCSRAFSMKPALEAHMRTHSSDRPFICSICRRAFRHPGHLDTHMKLHTGERPFACNMCTKRFTTTTHLKYHIKVHLGQRDYKCEYCDRAFINRSELKYHLVSHTQIKTCPCSICGKMFGRTYQVTKHMRQVHKIRKNFFAPVP